MTNWIHNIVISFLMGLGLFAPQLGATPALTTAQGGTGTSSPSGILSGDNNATPRLSTVKIGSGLSFSGGTLSATGGSPYPFPTANNGTTTLVNFYGNASTTQFTATSSAFLAMSGGIVGIATSSPGQSSLFGANGGGFFNGTVYASNFFDTALSGSTCIGESGGLLDSTHCVASIASGNDKIVASSPTGNVTLTYTGLATTSSITQGQLLYNATNGAGVQSVATGTISAGSSAITVTAGRAAVGGALAIDCATASGSQNGCLSSTDWATFNNKGSGTVTGVTGTYPILSSGGTAPVISTAFGTTTSWGMGNNGFVVTGATGIPFTAASSTLNLPNTALANSSIIINGTSVSLGGSITVSSTTLLANNNTFSGANIFNGNVTIGTLTGPLQAIAGLVSASSSLSVGYGGTGSTTSLGGILAGNGFNGIKSVVIGTNLTFDGTTLNATGGGSTYPFYTLTNFGTTTSATGTPMTLAEGAFASSTIVSASSTAPQNILLDATGDNVGWYDRIIANTYYEGTTTGTTLATGTAPWLKVSPTGATIAGTVNIGNLALTTNLSTVFGGTGLSGFTANQIFYSNSIGTAFVQTATTTLGGGTTGLTFSNTPFVIGGSPSALGGTLVLANGGTGTTTMYNGGVTFWNTGLSSLSQAASTTGLFFKADASLLGLGTTSPHFQLDIASSTGPQLGLTDLSGASNYWTFRSFKSTLYLATATPAGATSSVSNFSIDTNGKLNVWDVINQWVGVLSPTRYLSLQTSTTTAWTGSTTAPYVSTIVAPFSGTMRNVVCKTDASFLGVEVDIAGSAITPSYFVSSTTAGTVAATGGNTFTKGQAITIRVGTTTTASATFDSCTVAVTETP